MDAVVKIPWYKSKGCWAGVVGVVIGMYDAAIPLLQANFGIVLPAITPLIITILTALGLYGRVVAKNQIG